MSERHSNPAWTIIAILLALIAAPRLHAQGVLVDQVIAVVNGDLILESDVDEERRFEAFQPFRDPAGPTSRAAIIERLIDRTLILQQARMQPDDRVTIPEAEAQLATIRKEIPACKEFHCDTDAGWQKFVQSNGFTMPQLEELWRQRMQILKFIEIRFRAGIRITPDEIKTYYDKTLVPELVKQNTAPPPLDSVSDRIQEILLQQRVGSLLTDWLASLKAQGTVRIMKPGEEAP
jgi:peptidyl-prolyl cis-trans isomerase SurA